MMNYKKICIGLLITMLCGGNITKPAAGSQSRRQRFRAPIQKPTYMQQPPRTKPLRYVRQRQLQVTASEQGSKMRADLAIKRAHAKERAKELEGALNVKNVTRYFGLIMNQIKELDPDKRLRRGFRVWKKNTVRLIAHLTRELKKFTNLKENFADLMRDNENLSNGLETWLKETNEKLAQIGDKLTIEFPSLDLRSKPFGYFTYQLGEIKRLISTAQGALRNINEIEAILQTMRSLGQIFKIFPQ